MTNRIQPLLLAPNVGDRIEMIEMPDDPAPIPCGARGQILAVHDYVLGAQQINVRWDDGRTLALIVPPDRYRVINDPKS